MSRIAKIWWASLFIKLVLSAILPLSPDEAYYWVWSNHLQASYYDHPPMISWLLYLGHFFDSIGNAVRWPIVLIGHLTLLVGLKILQSLGHGDEKSQNSWMILALFSPLIGFGSLIATPDIPLLFFWSLTIYFSLQALQTKETKYFLYFGIALGLGFCSKYHIVLWPIILLIYLFTSGKFRELLAKNIGASLLGFLIFAAPVLIWNYQNDFISFRFQIMHGLGRKDWHTQWTTDYIAGQFLLLIPSLPYLFFKSWKQNHLRLLKVGSIFPFLFFLWSSHKGHVEANWPIVGYICALLFCACADVKNINRWLTAHSVFWSALAVICFSQIYHPWASWLPEKLSEPRQFQNMASQVKELAPLYADTYQLASILSYERREEVRKLYDMSRIDFYDFLENHPPQVPMFFLIKNKETNLPSWLTSANYIMTVEKNIDTSYEILKIRSK